MFTSSFLLPCVFCCTAKFVGKLSPPVDQWQNVKIVVGIKRKLPRLKSAFFLMAIRGRLLWLKKERSQWKIWLLLYYLRRCKHEFMVSIGSFKSPSIQRDVHQIVTVWSHKNVLFTYWLYFGCVPHHFWWQKKKLATTKTAVHKLWYSDLL